MLCGKENCGGLEPILFGSLTSGNISSLEFVIILLAQNSTEDVAFLYYYVFAPGDGNNGSMHGSNVNNRKKNSRRDRNWRG